MQKTKSTKSAWATVVLLAFSGTIPAFAQSTYTVTTTSDSGTGSLRAALLLATSGSDIINFNLTYPATITLTSDELHLNSPVTITGPGASSLTISGGGQYRVFEADSQSVSISGMTIANGTGGGTTLYPNLGGGIYNGFGTMTLTGVTLTSNAAAEGGAICNNGPMTITNSTISGNTATTGAVTGIGGGIFNYGTLTVSGSTISNNKALDTAPGTGANSGGIANAYIGLDTAGVLIVTNSTISLNSAPFEAGGIMNNNGTMTITNSTISGNQSLGDSNSAGQAGGVENFGTGTITASTISGNASGGGSGGIDNQGPLTITNSTISGNTAGYNGGGIENSGTGGALSISFTTFSGNRSNALGYGIGQGDGLANFGTAVLQNNLMANSSTGGNCYVYTGYPWTSQGYNLSDDTSCTAVFTKSSDKNDTPAGLDTGLKSNGGLTQTIALLSGSAAIDAVPVAACTDTSGNAVTTDQRGTARPQGPACDIGAFELVESAQSQTITFNTLANQPLGTAPFTVNATASSGLTVIFNSQTPLICAVSGTNGTTVTLGATGTCTIQATQAGNAQYAAATPVNQGFQVTSAALLSQTVSFGALANQQIGSAAFVLSATSSSSLAVSFASTTSTVCTVSVATVTMVAIGTCTIQATQPGNSIYAAALPVTQSFQVIGVPQTIFFGALPNQLLGAAPFAVGASSTSNLTVSFASITAAVCTVSSATVTLVAPGTCTIQATQAGNATYAAAIAVNQSFQVESTTPTTYGTFTRVNQFDWYDNADQIAGGVGISSTVDAAGSEIGENYALANFEPITLHTANGPIILNSGPGVGVESASNQGNGSARAVAFATFNAPSVPFHVNATLDGYFYHDPFNLPDGTLGNLQDQSNTGSTQVSNNTVSGNLSCQSNSMITGGGNTAKGQKQGQCKAF